MRPGGLVLRIVVCLAALPVAAQQGGGFAPILGGLPPSSGIAGGVEYRHPSLARGAASLNVRAIGSVNLYEHLDVRLGLPPLESRHLFAELRLRYRNYPEEGFWGLGPDSRKDDRTSFRKEDVDYSGAFGVHPVPWLRAGAIVGFLNVNTGPGKDTPEPSTEELFLPGDVPALDRQPHFRHTGGFAEVDYRKGPAGAVRGGFYTVNWTSYHDRTLGRYDFRRWDIDVRQFLPSFQPTATVAARFSAAFTEKDPGRQVPFFLQPTVGGGIDLRGYRQYRFRDQNSAAMNLEYRWRANEYLEAVAFTDAGRVFANPGDFGIHGVRTSVGVGGRLRITERLLVGLDVGWSREGLCFWFRGSEMF
ncbi:MAG TPA: BamA/TamA family outer membrane protein [Bryobacteraceae bacterium]|nr:BamA/TamA family outer membrane protein [Bryobacteraceae bacterium]